MCDVGLSTPPAGTILGSATYPHRKYHGYPNNVFYVHPDGSNTNDGMTWGTAFHDVSTAYDALPSPTGGEIYIASDVYWDDDNHDYGLWILGSNDPNVGSPPANFRLAKRCRFIGAAPNDVASNSHMGGTCNVALGSNTDTDFPGLWLAQLCGFYFENINFVYPATNKLGIWSDGTSASNSVVHAVTFKNCSFGTLGSSPLAGPTIDATGGGFWVYFQDCVFGGNGVPYSTSAASIISGTTARFTITTASHQLVAGETFYATGFTPSGYNGTWTVSAVGATTIDADIGTSPAAASVMGTLKPVEANQRAAYAAGAGGDIRFERCMFNQGGVRVVIPGNSSWGGIMMYDSYYEGDFGATPAPPIFGVYGSWSEFGTGCQIYGTMMADAESGAAAVNVDVPALNPTDVVVANAVTKGPCTVLNRGQKFESQTTTPAGYRQAGFHSQGRIVGQHDSSRRSFGPIAVRTANLAAQDTSTWSGLSGSGTVTTGRPAPDGTTAAAKIAGGGKTVYSASRTVALGDWYIAGVWARGLSWADVNSGPLLLTWSNSNNHWSNSGDNNQYASFPYRGDGEWEWLWVASDVAAAGTTPGTLSMSISGGAAAGVDFYAPILLVFAAADISDNEAMELAWNLQSWPDTATAGTVTTLRGQKLIARGGLGVGNSAAATTPGSVVKKMEVFSETGASLGFVPIYSSIT